MLLRRSKNTIFSSLLLLPLLATTGCSLSPLPGTNEQTAWIELKNKSQPYTVDQAWWTVYQEKYLNRLIEQGLKQNIDFLQSQLSTQKAWYQLQLNREEFWPTASASLKGQKNKNLENGEENTSFSTDLSVSYELDLWKKIAAKTQGDEHAYQASQQDVSAARLSLASAIIDAWFQCAYLDQSIKLMQKNISCYEQLETIAQARYLAGKTGRIALIQARQAVLDTRTRLSDLQKKHDDVLTILRDLLNLGPDKLHTLRPSPLESLPQQQIDLDIPISVLGQRPDLLAAEYRLREAWSRQQEQQQSWYPKISLRAGIGTSTNRIGKFFEMPVGVGAISVALPFLQWNTLRWQDKMTEANFRTAQLHFSQKLTTALNEVNSAYQHYKQAQENLAWNKEKLVLDQENSRHYQARYEAGSIELSDWIKALTAQYTTEQTIVQQRYQILRYENLIYKAMGGRCFKK